MVFFLGGYDLEMVTIRDALIGEGQRVVDHRLGWGARLSHCKTQMEAAFAAGNPLIAVELTDDLAADWPPRIALTRIDHHGERAGEPYSLRQIFALLALPDKRWTRHFALIAANDTGHVKAMAAMGASRAEMAAIRKGDRAAQGITPAEEAAGRIALAEAQLIPIAGGEALRVVRLPHARTATVTDPLALSGEEPTGKEAEGKEVDLLILSPESTHFFGAGTRITALDAAFPGGWRGGKLPQRGFWGVSKALELEKVARALTPYSL